MAWCDGFWNEERKKFACQWESCSIYQEKASQGRMQLPEAKQGGSGKEVEDTDRVLLAGPGHHLQRNSDRKGGRQESVFRWYCSGTSDPDAFCSGTLDPNGFFMMGAALGTTERFLRTQPSNIISQAFAASLH